MGLDNSITIKAKSSVGNQYLLDSKHLCLDDDNDIAYFRKCYNIRNRVLEAFEDKDYNGTGGKFELTSVEDLIDMINVFKYFLHEEHWHEGNSFTNGSIWTWYEVLPSIAQAIRGLGFLIEDIETGNISFDDIKILFYDSY